MQDRDRFDKFTERARKVLSLAQEEAQRFQHNYIGTEHLLLGLVHEEEGVAAKVLQNLGVELGKVREAVEFIINRPDRIILGEIGLTPRAKKVIELAVDEARRLNHHYIGTEHILLGLVREGEGIAAGVLESLGVTLAKVRNETIKVLSQSGNPQGVSPSEQKSEAQGFDYSGSFEPARARQQSDRDRFDKFTEGARKVLSLAQEEAQRLQHNYIGTEHLLLGLVREEEGVAGKVLRDLGVDLQKVRSAVEFIIGRGDRIVLGEIGLTPRAKKVIELAVDEARRLNQHYIGTEHILLGLVREGEGIAVGVLESLGVRLEQVRSRTIKMLKGEDNAPADDEEESIPPEQDVSAPGQKSETEDIVTENTRMLEQMRARLRSSQSSGRNRFDKFTERARKVLSLAQEEAQRFQHNYIGTEHLLLGLIREQEGIAGRVLRKLGVDIEKARSALESILGRGERIISGEIGLTPRAKKVIELAVDEARRLNHSAIGTEHLLLGLVREGEGIASTILEKMSVTLEQVRAETLKEIGPPQNS